MTVECLTEWQALQAALKAGGDVKASDYDCNNDHVIQEGADDTALVIPQDKDVTLDLNGIIINRTPAEQTGDAGASTTPVYDDNVITVEGKLTLTDNKPNQGHTGDLPKGGLITGGNTTDGGGVYVDSDATFDLSGGTIGDTNTGNTATYGGGVYVVGDDAEFTINSGTITDNEATNGGGVHVSDDGTFTMEGGTITNNKATEVGGGVYIYAGDNDEDDVDEDGCGTFNLSGNPTITGNTADNKKNNVYLPDGIMIYIADKLNKAASVGVTMENAPSVFTSGLSGRGTDENFSSDDPGYAVGLTKEREAQLVEIITSVAVDITAPVATVALDDKAETTKDNVTLINSGAITWAPEASDGKAAYNTAYTATVTAKVDDDEHVFASDVSAKVNGEEATVKLNNDGTLSISYTFRKTAQVLTITGTNKTVEYSPNGIPIPVDGMFTIPNGAGTPTYTVTGLIGNDRLTGALARQPGEAPGSYGITQGSFAAPSDNYALSFTGSTLIIYRKAGGNGGQDDDSDSDISVLATLKPGADGTSLEVGWISLIDADGFDIFYTVCGPENPYQIIGSVTAADLLDYSITGLKKGQCYKACVQAWRGTKDNKTYVGKPSPKIHAIVGGSNKTRCNAKKVKTRKSALTLKVGGKKRKIMASVVRSVRSKKVLKHVKKYRYFSTNRKVAIVSAKGKVKAVGAGTCTIFVLANNGVYKEVTVTVE